VDAAGEVRPFLTTPVKTEFHPRYGSVRKPAGPILPPEKVKGITIDNPAIPRIDRPVDEPLMLPSHYANEVNKMNTAFDKVRSLFAKGSSNSAAREFVAKHQQVVNKINDNCKIYVGQYNNLGAIEATRTPAWFDEFVANSKR
jgi:hypothetical protein